MILACILFFGILTLWAPRWALSAFQVALFAMAAAAIVRRIRSGRPIGWHPVGLLLGAAIAWGLMQIATHRTVDEFRTWDAVLNWTTNLAAFSLAYEATRLAPDRERFLRAVLIFAFFLSIVAIFTVLTSRPGKVFWIFETGSGSLTLGPFVYRNQYAAFVEAVLPLAILRAILDRRRSILYSAVAAVLFASVIAGGSRTGTFLCLAEILMTPVVAFARSQISGRTLGRVLAGCAAAAIVSTLIVGWEVIWNRLQEPNPYSLRADLVQSSLEMIRDRPVAGFGLGAWSAAYPAYARFDNGTFVNQAHNDWVQWAAEGGIPFFMLMLAIAIWCVRPALASLWGIGMLAVFAHGLIDYPMQQRPALAAFFFAMIGTLAAARAETVRK
ncbi:MAG TPA: O-antigen ligase family protein [Bryobacteraceae bacterium]|nr:O-antigen ligase family protein [Bryobacteraceae bacterium]